MIITHIRTTAMAVSALAAALPAAAQASGNIDLRSEVFVERIERKPDGATSVVLQTPTRVVPGDNLIFVLTYRNRGAAAARDFVITNPLPSAVAFQRSAEGDEQVSIDGGRNWGRLADLRVTERDGQIRHAAPEDVTHLRWRMPSSISAGQSGKLSFRGVVR